MKTARLIGVALVAGLMAVGGCSTVSKVNPFKGKKPASTASRGARIPVIALDEQLRVASALKGQDFFLPPPAPLAAWPLPGGAPEQSVENVEAAPQFVIAWKKTFGVGYARRRHIMAPPVAAGGRIFVMDGVATVSAHDANTGNQIWRTDVRVKAKGEHDAYGGGLAFVDGRLYVTSGYREVLALDAGSGAIVWRARTEAPIHAAPNVVAGRVYVSDVNDELLAFDAATGAPAWTYQALTEPARILAASSPAVANDTVVASFASGELVAVRAANGNELWNASLSRASRTNALSEIRDIAGRPVVYKSDVYAVSHSDVFAAVDLRTGVGRWTLPVSAITTPWPAGDVVFVVDQTGEVICVSRESGQIYWMRNLNDGIKKKKDRQRSYWSSPVLASSRLILVSTLGQAVALDPKTGATVRSLRLGDPALIGPIAVGGMVYVVTETGQLVAIR
jgi:outer membrane protein assembly factor BamB